MGCIPEVIENSESGFIVEQENPQAVAEKILYILGNKGVGEDIGIKARKVIEDRFRIDTTVRKTEELIDDVLKEGFSS